jgi:HSP20 family protein
MLVTTRDPFRQPSWFASTTSSLPVDVIRRESELELRVDVPGVRLEDLEVTVDRRVLTIRAVRAHEVAEGDQVVSRERRTGTASRSFTLSDGLDASGLAATLDQGVLTLRIPVAEAAKPHKIHIEVSPSAPAIEAAAN